VWADALPNLLIGLREGLEAGLVVSILLAAVRQSTVREHRPSSAPIWLGVLAAVMLALSFGAVLTFYQSVLSSTGQEALGGVLSVAAVALVTGMVFWMRQTARGLPGELRAKVAGALQLNAAALAVTAFMAVGREGVETAVFLWAAAQESGATAAPLIGAGIGIAAAVVLCTLLYHRAVKIRLDLFFNRTAVLLISIAAGVFAYGLGDLQDAGLLSGHAWVAFDLSRHITSSAWWVSVITGVTELSPTMTWLQVAAYLAYLATTLTLFVRSGRPAAAPTGNAAKDGPPAPADAPPSAPPGGAPPGGAPPAGAVRRRTVVTAAAASLVVPPAVTAGLIAYAPGAAANSQQITVTRSACAPGWSAAHRGKQGFTVVNKSGHTAEINLDQTASQGIVAEIETLAPGTSQVLSATLPPGDYSWRCLTSGLPTTVSASAHVGGSSPGGQPAPPAVKPVSAASLRPALNQYDAYVEGRLSQMSAQVAQLRGDLAAGQLTAARRDWLSANLTWEQVGEEPYGSFGNFGQAIGGGPEGLPRGVNDPHFTGLHRLEYGLWSGQQAGQLIPVADELSSDISALEAQLPQLTIDPSDLPTRAHEILEDALRDHLTGQTDQGAGAEYPETLADAQATRVVLGELSGLINSRAPELLPSAYQELANLQQAVLATRVNGQWPSLPATPPAQRQKVDAAIGGTLETLADVPDLLEVPAH
jgi:high-affinity iron transporter